MQRAVAVSFLIAVICPLIGMFLVVRKYSMLGDTLAHSSLAGVSIGLISGVNPIAGAFVFTSLCGLLIEYLRGAFRKYADLILNIVLSLSVGIAISIISSGKLTSNAESYLFGSILTISYSDMIMVAVLAVLSVGLVIACYHQLIYLAFDEESAVIAGNRVKLINYMFSVLVAACVAASVRIVGMLVLSSMIALPVASALQLKKGFFVTLLASVLFSITDIMTGLFLSYYLDIAPGGCTAIISVGMLLLVMGVMRIYSVFLKNT